MAKKTTKTKTDKDLEASFVPPEVKEKEAAENIKPVEPTTEEKKAVLAAKKEESSREALNKRLAADDEKRKNAVRPSNQFQMIKLSGEDRYRIVGKARNWISPVGTIKELSKLEAKLNSKDQEQKAINLPGKLLKKRWQRALPGEREEALEG